MSGNLALQSDEAIIVACTISRDVQDFGLLIDELDNELGEAWGDIEIEDALYFLKQPDSTDLDFVVLTVDRQDTINLSQVEHILQTAKEKDIKVILVADEISPVVLHQLLSFGGDEFLPYPLPEGALHAAIHRVRRPDSQHTSEQAPPPKQPSTEPPSAQHIQETHQEFGQDTVLEPSSETSEFDIAENAPLPQIAQNQTAQDQTIHAQDTPPASSYFETSTATDQQHEKERADEVEIIKVLQSAPEQETPQQAFTDQVEDILFDDERLKKVLVKTHTPEPFQLESTQVQSVNAPPLQSASIQNEPVQSDPAQNDVNPNDVGQSSEVESSEVQYSEVPSKPLLNEPVLPEQALIDDAHSLQFRSRTTALKSDLQHDAVIFAVHSLAGATGATTLAVNLAYELSRMGKSKGRKQPATAAPKVCLIDFGLQFGTVATFLDLPRRDAVYELLADTELMDQETFAQALVPYNDDLHVMTAPPEMLPLDMVSPEDITRIIEMARTNFDYVIIDMPKTVVQWTETVLQAAHLYFATLELDLRSAQNTLRMIKALKAEDLPIEKLRFVLNRAPKFTDLSGKGRAKKLAESLDISIEIHLPDGGKHVSQAADNGVPLSESLPKNALTKEIQKLAASVHELNQLDAVAN